MPRRVYFDANNFHASSPLRLVYALEDRGIFSRVIFPVGRSKYQPRPTDLLINWGNPPVRHWRVIPETLNKRDNVMLAIDKLACLKKLKEANVSCPKFTENYEEAQQWSGSHGVVGRSLLRSFQGRGIAYTPAETAPARLDNQGRRCILWTRYIPKKEEWRVHVFNGEAIDVTQKRRRHGVEVNNQIRSWDNGWVFARENLDEPDDLRSVGVAAVKALGMDFGAVDIIWNEKKNKCYVLEVNSAPACEGTTITKYADAIQRYIR